MSTRLLILVGVVVSASSFAAAGYYFFGPADETRNPPAPGPSTLQKPMEAIAEQGKPAPKSIANYHGAAVRAFIDTPGFGRGRMIRTVSQLEETYVHFSPGELEAGEPPVDVPDLAKAHQNGPRVFAPDARKEAASLPQSVLSFHYDQPTQRWRPDNVNLLAVVDHEQPIVYLTSKLRLAEQPGKKEQVVDKSSYTRGLDFFEIAGLEKLAVGEELYIRTKENHLRVLGALRADTSCLKCHEARVGELFGAFTYTLSKVNY